MAVRGNCLSWTTSIISSRSFFIFRANAPSFSSSFQTPVDSVPSHHFDTCAVFGHSCLSLFSTTWIVIWKDDSAVSTLILCPLLCSIHQPACPYLGLAFWLKFKNISGIGTLPILINIIRPHSILEKRFFLTSQPYPCHHASLYHYSFITTN